MIQRRVVLKAVGEVGYEVGGEVFALTARLRVVHSGVRALGGLGQHELCPDADHDNHLKNKTEPHQTRVAKDDASEADAEEELSAQVDRADNVVDDVGALKKPNEGPAVFPDPHAVEDGHQSDDVEREGKAVEDTHGEVQFPFATHVRKRRNFDD